jgi:hypothetical protein
MAKTFLQCINDVMIRLREPEVGTVTATTYAQLIGKCVNDGKRYVEDAWDWNILEATKTVTTSNNVNTYSIVGSGTRFKPIRVISQESDWLLNHGDANEIEEILRTTTVVNDAPQYFYFKGVDSSGDTKTVLYPTPNGVYNIEFDLIIPQDDLVNGSDELKVPAQPVILYATALAIRERGEDGGIAASEMFALAEQSLNDFISIEANRSNIDLVWSPY